LRWQVVWTCGVSAASGAEFTLLSDRLLGVAGVNVVPLWDYFVIMAVYVIVDQPRHGVGNSMIRCIASEGSGALKRASSFKCLPKLSCR
jgi:hypothetical protein